MRRIELAQLLRPTTTPEQELLLEHFYNQFDNSSAANKIIVNVEPLFYNGLIAGTEFLVYAATKLYICYSCDLTNGSGAVAGVGSGVFYDELNNAYMYANHAIPVWNTTTAALNYKWILFNIKNIYFSRIAIGLIETINFIGYRITLI